MPPSAISTPGGEISLYRLILQESKTKPFGNLISEAALLAALEPHGSVWGLTMSREGTTCHVTFRQPEAILALVQRGSVDINGLTVAIKHSLWHANTPVRTRRRKTNPSRATASRRARLRASSSRPPLSAHAPWLGCSSRRAPSMRRSSSLSSRSRRRNPMGR